MLNVCGGKHEERRIQDALPLLEKVFFPPPGLMYTALDSTWNIISKKKKKSNTIYDAESKTFMGRWKCS